MEIKELIQQAKHILIGAGAGMSAAAGIDYTDPVRFSRLFPEMYKRGYRNNYMLFGESRLPAEVIWGYHAMHVQNVAYDHQHADVYADLLSLVRDKDYFVITSNVDTMFAKNGFDEARIFTPQGNYKLMQCLRPCTHETWDSRPFLDRLLAHLDPVTHVITDPAAVPRCPNCGGAMFMNVRGGGWFIEEPYAQQGIRFQQWVNAHLDTPLLILEMGVGFNTPGVVRWPMEQILHHNKQANLIRFNRDHPQVPKERAVGVAGAIEESLRLFL